MPLTFLLIQRYFDALNLDKTRGNIYKLEGVVYNEIGLVA